MKTLEDEIRHILDYDSEETVALTFKTKARLVRNIVSTVEDYYASQKQPVEQLTDNRLREALIKYSEWKDNLSMSDTLYQSKENLIDEYLSNKQ